MTTSTERTYVSQATPIRRTLDGFKTRAVVDWLDVEIVTGTPTNFPTVQDRLQRILDTMGTIYVKPLDKGPGGGATSFKVRLHDPIRHSDLVDLFERLNTQIGLAKTPTVIAIEVAVDHFSRSQSRQELEEITLRLKHGIDAPADLWIESIKRKCGQRVENVSELRTDTTLRITGAGIGWRVYLKETDHNQQPITDPTQHCARVEVTLEGSHIPEALRDLKRSSTFRFESLTKHFQFRRFVDCGENDGPPASIEEVILRRQRHWAKRHGHRAMVPVRGYRRKYSTHTPADSELKERIRGALRDLSRRFFADKPEKS